MQIVRLQLATVLLAPFGIGAMEQSCRHFTKLGHCLALPINYFFFEDVYDYENSCKNYQKKNWMNRFKDHHSEISKEIRL